MSRGAGMLCPTCGGLTRTLRTHATSEGFVLRRRRECEGIVKHAFTTYEINETVWGSVSGRVFRNAVTRKKVTGTHARNEAIISKVLAGTSVKVVAHSHGLKATSVSKILSDAGIGVQRYRKDYRGAKTGR